MAVYHGSELSDLVVLGVCPFCGNEPTITQIGNNHTKKRTIEIKCQECKVQMSQSAVRNDVEWLQFSISEKWNKRK